MADAAATGAASGAVPGLPRQWISTMSLLLRTRHARRRGDAEAVLRAAATQGGTTVRFALGRQRVLLVLTPDLAGQVLVDHAAHTVKGPGLQRTRPLLGDGLLTSQGQTHHRVRRLVAPAFSPGRLAAYTDVFTRRTGEHVAAWTDGTTLDLHREMSALTLHLVGRTLLGVDLTTDTTGVRTGLDSALARFADDGPLGLRGQARARRARTRDRADPEPGTNPLHAVVDRIIAQRRASPATGPGDIVSALLAASGEPGGLSQTEVHDHVITLLLAGHETTANALTWTLYLLGEHPHIERRLHRELAGPGAPAYTRAVISEAMRLYPPAWIIGRRLTTDLHLDGRHTPAGTLVAVSPLLLHRDPRWFPDPQRFDPDRWLDERRTAVPRYAYLPFGAGSRSCIGEQFAWTEATTVLAVIASRWTARSLPGRPVRPEYRVTLRPAGGLPATLRART